VRIWDARDRKLLHTLVAGKRPVHAVAFHGAVVAGSCDDGTIRLWEAASGRELWWTPAHGAQIWSLAFSPDGARLASASSDGTVGLWDVATGDQCSAAGGGGKAYAVAWSGDGTLASGFADGSIHLSDGRVLRGHEGGVWSLAWRGRTLASSARDDTVRLWDGAGRRVLRGHKGEVFGVAWSPDGRTLASAGADRTIRLWQDLTADWKHAWDGAGVGSRAKFRVTAGGKSRERTVVVKEVARGHVDVIEDGERRVIALEAPVEYDGTAKRLADEEVELAGRKWACTVHEVVSETGGVTQTLTVWKAAGPVRGSEGDASNGAGAPVWAVKQRLVQKMRGEAADFGWTEELIAVDEKVGKLACAVVRRTTRSAGASVIETEWRCGEVPGRVAKRTTRLVDRDGKENAAAATLEELVEYEKR